MEGKFEQLKVRALRAQAIGALTCFPAELRLRRNMRAVSVVDGTTSQTNARIADFRRVDGTNGAGRRATACLIDRQLATANVAPARTATWSKDSARLKMRSFS